MNKIQFNSLYINMRLSSIFLKKEKQGETFNSEKQKEKHLTQLICDYGGIRKVRMSKNEQ